MRCSYPVTRFDKSKREYITYPCGQCRACRKNKAREWGFRAFAESLSFKNNCIFLSLTFDDENLIYGSKGFATLDKAVLQTFWKDFRYYVCKCRYLACGEYGDDTHRPHFHAIVYGVNLDNPVFTDLFYSPRKKAFIGKCKAWKYGEVCIGDVTIGSCQYCAKYVVKRKTGKSGKAYYEKYGIQPEFATMSRRPGLGLQYLYDNFNLIKSRGYLMIKGHKIPIPRYYLGKMYDDNDEEEKRFRRLLSEVIREESNEKFFKNRDIGNVPRDIYLKNYLANQEINLEKMEKLKG